jgi:uncharacterized Tic20 family protein
MSDPESQSPDDPVETSAPAPEESSSFAHSSAPSPASSPPTEKEERTWALFAHLSSLSSFIGIPGFVGPLIIWLVKKDDMPFASAQAKEALNFQISLFIYLLISGIFIMTGIGAIVGIPAIMALVIIEVIFTIIATIQASEGKPYRYPMTIRLIE